MSTAKLERAKPICIGLACAIPPLFFVSSLESPGLQTCACGGHIGTAMSGMGPHTVVPIGESLESQVSRLADFIMRKYPDWPGNRGESEGAIDCAIRIMGGDKTEGVN